jgi:hypothetical protein
LYLRLLLLLQLPTPGPAHAFQLQRPPLFPMRMVHLFRELIYAPALHLDVTPLSFGR